MSQSLKVRFNGNIGEVVKHAREFGILATMEQYQVKDYIAMFNFLKESAPGEEFRTTHIAFRDFAGLDAFDNLAEAVFRKFSKMDAAYKAVVAENIELKKRLNVYSMRKQRETTPIVQSLLEYCKQDDLFK